jgi:hypothetical protein
MEWYSENLFGIDSDSSKKTQSLIKVLEDFQEKGLIEYEIGNP